MTWNLIEFEMCNTKSRGNDLSFLKVKLKKEVIDNLKS